MQFNTIPEAISAMKRGEFVIVVDDENRENEGDMVIAANHITPAKIAFMLRHTSGIICMPCSGKRLDELKIPMMTHNTDQFETPFTISIDAKSVKTGVSAEDRCRTIKTIIHKNATRDDFVMPGHVFPLRANPGGVLKRAGHTEASVDLCRIAGLFPASVICEVMNPDGTVAKLPDLFRFAQQHNIKVVTIPDLIKFRRRHERFIETGPESILPTDYGNFRVKVYSDTIENQDHVVLIKGDVKGKSDVLVRVHSECLTGDVFGSRRCDCHPQLEKAMEIIAKAGKGVVLYMRQEGRGIGIANKIKAYALQDRGLDTVEANEELGLDADLRDYGIGAQILSDLGLTTIRLLTNNPKKVVGIEGYGLKITGRIPLEVPSNEYNRRYLNTKRDKMGHWLR